MWRAALGLTVILAIVLVLGSLSAASSGRPLRAGEKAPSKDEMLKHLVWGLVYSNPDDPRGWVPKIRGVGWTMNVRTSGLAKFLSVITIMLVLSVIAMIGLLVLDLPALAR